MYFIITVRSLHFPMWDPQHAPQDDNSLHSPFLYVSDPDIYKNTHLSFMSSDIILNDLRFYLKTN